MTQTLQLSALDTQSISRSKAELTQTLDDLLEQYLNLLDQYQLLQTKLSKQLASGYLDLAQANFSNPNRIRYGQDFYDERMQASTQVIIKDSNPRFSINHSAISISNDKDDKGSSEPSGLTSSNEKGQHSDAEKNRSQKPQDPLRWFGVLIPPALRSSQASFKNVVHDVVPALTNVMAEMKEVEIEVRRTRKRISKLQ